MKRILALILILMMLFTSCDQLPEELLGYIGYDKIQKDETPENTGNETPEHTHNYIPKVIQPTCVSAGYTLHTCEGCEDSYIAEKIEANGHSEEVIPGKAPTSTEDGLTDGKQCSVCNAVTLPQQTIPAVGHNYVTTVTPPTCTEDGYTTYSCIDCNDTFTTATVPALGHTEQTLPEVLPTCTLSGKAGGKICLVCNTITEAQTVTSALGHNEETIPGKAATATENGLTDGKICTVCGVFTVQQTTIPATGHTYTATVVAPTCTEAGYTTYTCTDCGDTFTADDVAALGHTEVTVTGKAATCTATGLTDGKKCTVCDTITVAQTTIAALGHTEVTVTGKAATCTATGLTDGKKCSVCNTVTVAQTVISTIAHTEETVTGKAATCTATGLTDGKKCTVCGTVTVSQTTIAKLEHSEETVPGRLATCTATGLTDGKKCTVCGTVTVVQTTISAIGHSWLEATTEAPKTCLACGLTEGDKLSGSTTYAETLYVHYINVGQGDSIFMQVGDCDILIDAGTASYGSTVSSYLKKQNVDDLELVINTHPDADHCGGLTQVFKDYVVEEVWISKDTSKTTAAYKNFVSAISSEGLTAKHPSKGQVYTYENLTITVLYSSYISGDTNNSSIVVMVEYGSFRFLMMGDVGQVVEPSLVSDTSIDLSCDVLKVGHHGSKYSSTASFLAKVDAEYGVICVGSNTYGHPTSDALNRLSAAGVSVYRTDKNGDVVFSTNGVTLTLPNGTTDSTGSGSGSIASGSSGSSGSSSSSGSSGSSGTTSTSEYFIGNKETKVFHLPTCSNLPATSKQNVMYNYSWIINIAGYTPCGRCLSSYSGSSSGTTTRYIANATSKVYHLSTCSYLPDASNRVYITSTTGYTPCGHCIN